MYGTLPFEVDSSNSTAFFGGDVVVQESDGNVAPAAAGDLYLLGSCQGSTSADYATKAVLAASTAGTVLVTYHPSQIYITQMTTGTTQTQTMIGNNADHVAGTGSATTGISGHTLSGTTGAGTAGFKILHLLDAPDNAAGDAARLLVLCNEHISKVVDATASAIVGSVGV
jgi:hypothetical protein